VGDRHCLKALYPAYLFTACLSLFVIPKRVVYKLERIQRDFLWVGGGFGQQAPSCKLVGRLLGKTKRGLEA